LILKNLVTNTSLSLSHDLRWIDEHSWSKVVSNAEYSITGALIIESAVKQAGRFITLQHPEPEMAWHTRDILDQLLVWASVPDLQMQLTLDDGRMFVVVFRHQESPVIESEPVTGIASSDPDSWWRFTLKLMEI